MENPIHVALRELYTERETLWNHFHHTADPYDLDVIIMQLRANEQAIRRIRRSLDQRGPVWPGEAGSCTLSKQ